MAYVFSNIEGQMNSQQPNIFGQPGQGPQGGDQGQQQGGSVQKSDNSGSLDGAGGQQGSGSVGTANAPAAAAPSQAGIATKNQFQGAGNLQGIKEAQTGIKDVSSKIQDESTKLAGSAAIAPTGAPDAGTLAKVGRDDSATSSVRDFLSSKAPTIKEQTLSTDTTVPNLTALNSPQARQALLQSQHKGNYTGGMAALDNTLLGQSKEFQNIMGQLNAGQTANDAAKATGGATAQQEAQKKSDKNWADAQAGVKDSLNSNAIALRTAAQEKAVRENIAANAAYQAKVDAANAAAKQYGGTTLKTAQDLQEQLRGSGLADTYGLGDIINNANTANGGYQAPAWQSNYTYMNEMDPETIAQYNSMRGLSGNSGMGAEDANTYNAAPDPTAGRFDLSGYQSKSDPVFKQIQDALLADKTARDAKTANTNKIDINSGNTESGTVTPAGAAGALAKEGMHMAETKATDELKGLGNQSQQLAVDAATAPYLAPVKATIAAAPKVAQAANYVANKIKKPRWL